MIRVVVAALAACVFAAPVGEAVASPAAFAAKKKSKCKKKGKKSSAAKKKKCAKPGSGGGGGGGASTAAPVPPGDLDGDGLPNAWEVNGSPAGAPLQSYGASMNRKDVFVELDYFDSAVRDSIDCGDLAAIHDAFANAPVSNPDGSTGINLHVDAGRAACGAAYDLGGSRILSGGPCPGAGNTISGVFNAIGSQFPASRVGSFHVAGVVSNGCPGGGGEGGAATLHGSQMAIFTGGAVGHVLMHELGHNLGLDHTAPAPNRLSVMYNVLATSSDGNGSQEVLDYQRYDLPELEEANLSEAAGIGGPAAVQQFFVYHYCSGVPPTFLYSTAGFYPDWGGDGVDWNCNSADPPNPFTPDPAPVAADINGDGDATNVFPATSSEWPQLDYASGGQIGS